LLGTLHVAAAVATVTTVTPIGVDDNAVGDNAVSAQDSHKGVFAKSAGIYDLYDKISVPVRVYDRLIQVAAAAYIRWSVAHCAAEKQVRHGLTPYAATAPWG